MTPGLGRFPGGGHGNPLHYSCLENSKDRGAWQVQSMGSQRVGHDCNTAELTGAEYFTFSSVINCDLSVVVAPCVQLTCTRAGRKVNPDFRVSSGKYLAYSAQIP